MRGGAEWSGPTSRTRDQTGVGQLLVSQEAVRPSPDSRSWSGTVDEWLPRRRTARGRPEAGGRLAGCGQGRAGGQAGAVRGLSWDTILAAVDLTTCLFPANPQSPLIDSFHAALQIARALCSVPPHIAVPEHAVLDLWTVGRSAHGVTREQLAALRGAHRHLDRRDGDQGAVAADRLDTALNHVISTWRVRTTRSSVWPFCPTRMPACSHAPCCHQGSRMTERVSTRFIIMIHAQHH